MRAWTIVGGFFIALNLCSFALFGWDKSRARRDAWRISERALLLAAACFGGTGALLWAKQIIGHLGVFRPDTLEAWYAYFSTGEAQHFFALIQTLPSAAQ